MATLATKVQAAVDKAFLKVDSLLKDVEFSNKVVTGFNLATKQSNFTTTVFNTRGLVERTVKETDVGVVAVTTLMVKTGGVAFSKYTTAVIEGVVYTCSVQKADAFITILTLVKQE